MKKDLLAIIVIVLLFVASCKKDNDENGFRKPEKTQSEFITLKSGVIVKKEGDKYVWLGDVLLTKEELKLLDETGSVFGEQPGYIGPVKDEVPSMGFKIDKSGTVPRSVGVHPNENRMWAMVRFVYDPNLTWDRRDIIQQAIEHWEANTNVRFYNATRQPIKDPIYGFYYPYVYFTNGTSNQSYVGRKGGKQDLTLAQYQLVRSAIHEIGHAVGLYHEQCRADRDNYIDINVSNIRPGNSSNFDKVTGNYYMIGGLDYNSIMIYPSIITDPAFVYNTSIWTMRRKDQTTWGLANSLSANDRIWANTFYLPYIARSDVYRELADIVYKTDNTVMTPEERLALQAQLNNGNPNPPPGGRIPNSPYNPIN